MSLCKGSLAACLLAGLLPSTAAGADLLGATYNPATDELVVDIAYRGTHQNHQFTLDWGACQRSGEGRHRVVARIIDRQGDDIARTDFHVRERFDLDGLGSRPALVTLRLGRIAHATVLVPDEEQAAGASTGR